MNKWTIESQVLLLDYWKKGVSNQILAERFDCTVKTIQRQINKATKEQGKRKEAFEKIILNYKGKVTRSHVAMAWSIYKYSPDSAVRYLNFVSSPTYATKVSDSELPA